MLKELKRYNNIGDKNGLAIFLEQVLTGKVETITGLIKFCNFYIEGSFNSKCAIALLQYLGVIDISDDRLVLTRRAKYLNTHLKSGKLFEGFAIIVLKSLLEKEVIKTENIKLIPLGQSCRLEILQFPLYAALFRNLLIVIEKVDLIDGKYILDFNGDLEFLVNKFNRRQGRRISEAELLSRLESFREQGEIAEKWVCNYEKERLGDTHLCGSVKLISKIDISAGYDILSFNSNDSSEFDRFIEVKSFCGNPHFYWTKNERDVASIKGDNYFIYLVNFERMADKDYCPIIIKNPFFELRESGQWLLETENVRITALSSLA